MANEKKLAPGTKITLTGFASYMNGFDSLKKLFDFVKFPAKVVTVDDYGDSGESIVKFKDGKTASLMYFDFKN